MPSRPQHAHHCADCPVATQQDPANPSICSWKPDAVLSMSAHRQQVIYLVQRLQHNDTVRWCNQDAKLRRIVIRSVVIALKQT
jgi:hypothetical protein